MALFTVALSASGCNNEGEGERCDTNDDNNGASDCASGLQCDPSSGLPGAQGYGNSTEDPTLGICCPANPAQATTTVCAISPTPPNSDASVPASVDAGADASTDAPLDSATDAILDSPVDALLDSPIDAPLDAPVDASSDSATD